jgi:hypothetical protein
MWTILLEPVMYKKKKKTIDVQEPSGHLKILMNFAMNG